MLDKNYSTATIIMAANVLDGGKSLSDVPAQYHDDVVALTGITTPTAPVVTAPAKTDTAKPLTVEA